MIADYLEHGLSVIPVQPRSKIPDGPWAHAQAERASHADIAMWQHDGLNLGVVTGVISNLVVLDCDSFEGIVEANRRGLPITPTVSTGKGKHFWFSYPYGQEVRNAVRISDGIDVRGEGGYVLAPPSTHPNGATYAWVTGLSLADVPLAPCPAWLLEAVTAPLEPRPASEWGGAFSRRVGNGERNQRCAELAGYLLRKGVALEAVEAVLLMWNDKRCSPAMSEGEVRRVVASIAAREDRRVRP